MEIVVESRLLDEIEADAEVVFIANKDFNHRWVKHKELLASLEFKAEAEDIMVLLESKKIYLALDKLDTQEIREASAKAIRAAKKSKFKSLKTGVILLENDDGIKALIEGFLLGEYEFNRYKSKKNENSVEKLYISKEEYSNKDISISQIESALNWALVIANSVNFTRDIVNTPPDDMTPIKLAEVASNLANKNGFECKVYDENFLESNGMNLFKAVSRASTHPPRLIHMIYSHPNKKAKIAIVGKGLTYDSGGLSLKPSDYMQTMKADKGGGSAVIGILKAISELNLELEVHGVIGATENMIGGNAYKPDDVLIAKNKKSVEIINTDAEGRLVLADCLCYIQELSEFDYIIDIATLTGACVVALGEYTFGVMGFNDKLRFEILKAAKESGELAAELPFNKYLKKLLKSEIADIINACSTRYGGAVTAGLFLSEFIEDKNKEKWVHLDIAGPAFVEKEWGVNPSGASGSGVRTVIKWLYNLSNMG